MAHTLRPVLAPPLRVLARSGRVLGRAADLVWRIPLIVAALAMAVAAVAHARGDQDLAWRLVTGGFAIGLLGVPLGLISLGLGHDPESDPGADPSGESAGPPAGAGVATQT